MSWHPIKHKEFKTKEGFTCIISQDVSYSFIRIQMYILVGGQTYSVGMFSMTKYAHCFSLLKERLRLKLQELDAQNIAKADGII